MKFWKIWEKFSVLIISVILILVFSVITRDILKLNNIINLLIQSSVLAIAGAGMTLAITSGGFDLSVGSILALTTCIMGKLIPEYGVFYSSLIAIGVGALCGFLNGIIITKVKIPAFVTTLATMIIIQGIALIYTKGEFIPLFGHAEAKVFSSGKILNIPVPILLMLFVNGFIYIIYRFTSIGVYIRGIGSNNTAARISGINVDQIIILVFIFTAVTSVFSGFIVTSQLLTGAAVYGGTFALEVITVTILGGTSLSGGKGYVWGTLMAAIMIGIIKSGLTLLGFSGWIQQFVIGIVLLVSLAVGGIRSILAERIVTSSILLETPENIADQKSNIKGSR